MNWFILAAVVTILFLLSRVRLGGGISYRERILSAWIRIGFFRLSILPKKKKKEKPIEPIEEKKKGREDSGESKEKEGFFSRFPPKKLIQLAKIYLPLVGRAAGRLRRKIRIDRLVLNLRFGGPDPADAVEHYGCANGALGALWPKLVQSFRWGDCRIHTQVDFDGPPLTAEAELALSMTLGQLLCLAFWLLKELLCALHATRKLSRTIHAQKSSDQKEAVEHGT